MDAFAFTPDGQAKDPKAFQEALKSDTDRLSEINKDPELAGVLLGDDVQALQQLLKSAYEVAGGIMQQNSIFIMCKI